MASKKLSSDTSLANSYKLSRGLASVARPSAPTIGTATDGGSGNMSVTFTASTLGPTASSFTLTSSSGVTGSGASSPLILQETAVGTYTYSVYGTNANGNGPSSAASNSVNVTNVFAPSGAYDSIATTTVGAGGSSSITFSSIPSTYTHLQIRAIGIGTGFNYAGLNFNSDTGSNYSYHQLNANGSTVSASGGANSNVIYTLQGGTSATFPAVGVIDILDYANTNKYKTVRSLSGYDQNGAGELYFRSGAWLSTSAVTSIQITGSTSFAQYTQFALFGIKGN